jgi:apolipoprotein N-acyltransferase
MKSLTTDQERRRGIAWVIGSIVMLAAMSGMWWLVESTNREGEHDAQLLPWFALIPLAIGMYHLVRARRHAHHP